MKNKTNKLLSLIIMFCIMLPITGAIAYFRANTSSQNKLSSGNIGITLKDKTTNQDAIIDSTGINFTRGYPGAVKDKETFVQNTSDNDLYTRIKVTKYWQDEAGNKVIDANAGFIEIITDNPSNWIIQDNDENHEVVYFYYKNLLKPQAISDLFINKIKLSGEMDNNEALKYSNLFAQIDFEAEAVQQIRAKQAMLSEWGIDVEIDNNNVMQAVED